VRNRSCVPQTVQSATLEYELLWVPQYSQLQISADWKVHGTVCATDPAYRRLFRSAALEYETALGAAVLATRIFADWTVYGTVCATDLCPVCDTGIQTALGAAVLATSDLRRLESLRYGVA